MPSGAHATIPSDVRASYAALACEGTPQAVAASVLRSRSRAGLDLLAHAATGGRMGWDEVISLHGETLTSALEDPVHAGLMARPVASLPSGEHDLLTAGEVYRAVDARHGVGAMLSTDQRTAVQVMLRTGHRDEARELLARSSGLNNRAKQSLEVDLFNPFRWDLPTEPWLERFNRRFLTGLEGIAIEGSAEHPFDRMTARATQQVDDGPLVTVVVTAFRPDEGLLTSVRSLLEQSWRRLDVLVVDDDSGPAFDHLLDAVTALDDRVRLLRLQRNGGTYVARNAGLAAARGEVVAFQDSDDWSHPRRIELQVRALLEDEAVRATRSWAVRVDDDLFVTRIGQLPERVVAISLMFRRSDLELVGGFDTVRKAADSELHERIQALTGRRTLDLREILSVVRLRSGSLSRGDFLPGWHHPARVAYRRAFAHWHQEVLADPRVDAHGGRRMPFPAPARFHPEASDGPVPRYDVVLVADWRAEGVGTRQAVQELRLLVDAGVRVAVAGLDDWRYLTMARPAWVPGVQSLVNSGAVACALPTEELEVDRVVLASPHLVQVPPGDPVEWRVGSVDVMVGELPRDPDGGGPWFELLSCDANAVGHFGAPVRWVPRTRAVDRWLRSAGTVQVAPDLVGPVVDVPRLDLPRRGLLGRRPAVGARVGPGGSAVPLLREALDGAWDVDVRLLVDDVRTGGSVPEDGWPTSWLVYGASDVGIRDYLGQVDVFVHLPGPGGGDPTDVLSAMACGAVVITHPEVASALDDVPLTCRPDQVPQAVQRLHADPQRFLRRSDRARALAGADGGAQQWVSFAGSRP